MRSALTCLPLVALLVACPKESPPKPAAAPASKPAPAPKPPAPKPKPSDVKLECPKSTVQVNVRVLDGQQVYCRDRAGVTAGPYRRVDNAGGTLIARTFRGGSFEGAVEVFEEGKLRLKGTDQADHLHDFEYVGEGPAGKSVDAFLRGELERAGVCAKGESCVRVTGVCPFGCDIAVNAKHEARAKRWLSQVRGTCEYKCAPPTGRAACVDGACEMVAH